MPAPLVGIIMGSISDYETMRHAEEVLAGLEVPLEVAVVSAHRTPEHMVEYAKLAESRGLEIIIAGAGGAAHLPGMVASMTQLPVLGVPVRSSTFSGVDSLLSIVQMPGGVPTATFAVGVAGAVNAGLFAARMLAIRDRALRRRLDAYVAAQVEKVLVSNDDLQARSVAGRGGDAGAER